MGASFPVYGFSAWTPWLKPTSNNNTTLPVSITFSVQGVDWSRIGLVPWRVSRNTQCVIVQQCSTPLDSHRFEMIPLGRNSPSVSWVGDWHEVACCKFFFFFLAWSGRLNFISADEGVVLYPIFSLLSTCACTFNPSAWTSRAVCWSTWYYLPLWAFISGLSRQGFWGCQARLGRSGREVKRTEICRAWARLSCNKETVAESR